MTMCAFMVSPIINCAFGGLLRYIEAYQSAMLTTPLVVLRILASLLRFPSFLLILFTALLVVPAIFMA